MLYIERIHSFSFSLVLSFVFLLRILFEKKLPSFELELVLIQVEVLNARRVFFSAA